MLGRQLQLEPQQQQVAAAATWARRERASKSLRHNDRGGAQAATLAGLATHSRSMQFNFDACCCQKYNKRQLWRISLFVKRRNTGFSPRCFVPLVNQKTTARTKLLLRCSAHHRHLTELELISILFAFYFLVLFFSLFFASQLIEVDFVKFDSN